MNMEGGKTTNRKLIDRLLKNGENPRCYYCGKFLPYRHMTLEHLCPTTCHVSRMPNNNLYNLKISCAKCNNEKIPRCKRDCS
jgi:5-methylcytosine-specific restriction endonuclease McrA